MTVAGELTELEPMGVLEHAEQLVSLSAEPGPVSAVHARRAVSAAYYAVLHRLCLAVAATALPGGSAADRHALCRSFSHASVEVVARWVVGAAVAPAAVGGLVRGSAGPELRRYAERVLQLQAWRMHADYDHERRIGRPLALLACHGAREAISALDAARAGPGWPAFSSLMLHRGRW